MQGIMNQNSDHISMSQTEKQVTMVSQTMNRRYQGYAKIVQSNPKPRMFISSELTANLAQPQNKVNK